MENSTASEGKDPSGFLSEILGAPVTVKLNSGVVYKGELQSVDGYMNIALEKTEEYVDGKLRRNYGDAFVRGNNGSIPFESPCPGLFAIREADGIRIQLCTFPPIHNDREDIK